MNTPSQYQPTLPEEFIGKTSRIASLLFKKAEQLKLNSGSAKWLFTGSPGLGKTRLAEALAGRIAGHPTCIEQLNGQSLSVDVVREWERGLVYKRIGSDYSVRIIDEVDVASPAAQNELRTYLDRIRAGTVVIATTNKEVRELAPQLQTRFSVYQFEPVTAAVFAEFMVKAYGFDYMTALEIGQRNLGCVRSAMIDAESWLDGKALQ